MWLHKSLSLFLHDRKKVENIEENEEGKDKEKGKEERRYALDEDIVQFSRSVASNSLRPHESQHARPPCPSPTPGVHLDSRPWSQ